MGGGGERTNLLTRQGEGAIVAALAFSSDGRYAASSDVSLSKHPVFVWDLTAGKRIKGLTLKDKGKELVCAALSFSPDDRRVMAASTSGAVRSWDLATEQEQPAITLEAGPIKPNEFPCAAFGADRQHLLTGSQSGSSSCGTCRTARGCRLSLVTWERLPAWLVRRTDGSSFPAGATTPLAYGTWPAGRNSSD